MNDNASNSDHSGVQYNTVFSISTLNCHKVSILVANVYLYNLKEWLLRGSLLPCYKKLKSRTFFKRLEAFSIEFGFHKILYVSEHFSCEEENARKKMNAKFRWHFGV